MSGTTPQPLKPKGETDPDTRYIFVESPNQAVVLYNTGEGIRKIMVPMLPVQAIDYRGGMKQRLEGTFIGDDNETATVFITKWEIVRLGIWSIPSDGCEREMR